MQFYEINICQLMICRIYTVYNKHEMIKIGNQAEKNCKYYRKCWNNFAIDCTSKTLQRFSNTYRTIELKFFNRPEKFE